MHARIYDFTLGAGGMQRLPVVGDFFKVISATGTINVNVDTGATLDLMPGQGLREFNFNTLTITDKSGAANAGKLLVGFSGMIDDRITGEVSVIDGGKVRSMAGSAFSSASGVQATAGNYPVMQLINPAESGKNIVIKTLSLTMSAAGQIIVSAKVHANQTLIAAAVEPKDIDGGAVSVMVRRSGSVAALEVLRYLDAVRFAAAGTVYRVFQEPIVLRPGKGIDLVSDTASAVLNYSCEWLEEPV